MFQVFKDDRAGPLTWMSYSACQDTDPDLFFPIAAAGPALRQIAEAKAICARCPVLTDCLNYALETSQDTGVWGGTSEEERWPPHRLPLQAVRKCRADAILVG